MRHTVDHPDVVFPWSSLGALLPPCGEYIELQHIVLKMSAFVICQLALKLFVLTTHPDPTCMFKDWAAAKPTEHLHRKNSAGVGTQDPQCYEATEGTTDPPSSRVEMS
ncbi:hypothetical protein XENORESO_007000 [Xenotaenia resolanae]|uniref:Uncharacterized protein n=1 Tax=Xenotaenia resolanae TaxID=208358 RepID=A0ABV0WJ25_9TELE